MLILHVAGRGRVRLAENNMTDKPETRFAPCIREKIDAIPRVEADAKRIRFQDAVDLREGRAQPVGVVVICNRAPSLSRKFTT